jgi:hypothetical protein
MYTSESEGSIGVSGRFAVDSGPEAFAMLEETLEVDHLPFIDEPDALAGAVREFLLE